MDAGTLTLSAVAKHFSDEEAAWRFLEQTRWPDGPVCPHCGAVDHAYYLCGQEGSPWSVHIPVNKHGGTIRCMGNRPNR
jgi:hypothetical protein